MFVKMKVGSKSSLMLRQWVLFVIELTYELPDHKTVVDLERVQYLT